MAAHAPAAALQRSLQHAAKVAHRLCNHTHTLTRNPATRKSARELIDLRYSAAALSFPSLESLLIESLRVKVVFFLTFVHSRYGSLT